ncbi:DUF1983 domain-containing protein, partial [Rodentibacter rarus]|uniref:DUF1983 domain-containing protein n=1 Tax=Rodentibacter rarus TaxID=1908260 RepID=UPI0021181555
MGETYTLSFFARGNISKLDYCYLMRDEPGGNMLLPSINMLSEEDFRFYKVTFTTYFATERASILLGFRNSVVDQWVEFHSLKLERGTIATDWIPAPEDIETTVNTVSAKIDNVQSTLSNADKALASRIDTVNASVNNAKAQISTVSQAVANVNGKLSATHTIKTQTISGGKTAIAGITLGANREESTVIVMADRFQVVKNAQDGSPKPM